MANHSGPLASFWEDLFLPKQPKITREAVKELHEERPRRICFATSHKESLKYDPGKSWVGKISVPFYDSVCPIFHEMTGLKLFKNKNFPSRWRSIYDDEEFEEIKKWVAKQGRRVFLRDTLALSIALSEHNREDGGRSEIGEWFYRAKYRHDSAAIESLIKAATEAVTQLPFYKDVDAVVAIPPSSDKDFDLPSIVAGRIAKEIGAEHLTSRLSWTKSKPSLKNVSFDKKWDALDAACLHIADDELHRKTVLLVDDMYQSGMTMQYVAMTAQKEGAKRIYGLALVKARRDSDNL